MQASGRCSVTKPFTLSAEDDDTLALISLPLIFADLSRLLRRVVTFPSGVIFTPRSFVRYLCMEIWEIFRIMVKDC